MYYCVIVGNVRIPSNDNILSGCDIYDQGNGNVCASDFRFTDANQNKSIELAEVAAALSCK